MELHTLFELHNNTLDKITCDCLLVYSLGDLVLISFNKDAILIDNACGRLHVRRCKSFALFEIPKKDRES